VAGLNVLGLMRVAALVGASLLPIGAVSAGTASVNAMLSLTENDDGRTVEVRAGDTVRINLPENATTGYRWAIDRIDQNVIEAVGSEPHYTGKAVGSGGQVTFTLRAKKTGSSDVVLKNWRHFEGDASVTKRFRVRVEVKP
jgi:inhibitor of cysteine peptidase